MISLLMPCIIFVYYYFILFLTSKEKFTTRGVLMRNKPTSGLRRITKTVRLRTFTIDFIPKTRLATFSEFCSAFGHVIVVGLVLLLLL